MEEINENQAIVDFPSLHDRPRSSHPQRRNRSLSPSHLVRHPTPRLAQSPSQGFSRLLDNPTDTQTSTQDHYSSLPQDHYNPAFVGPSSAIPQPPLLTTPNALSRDPFPRYIYQNPGFNGPQNVMMQQQPAAHATNHPFAWPPSVSPQETAFAHMSAYPENYQHHSPPAMPYPQDSFIPRHSFALSTPQYVYPMTPYFPQSPQLPVQDPSSPFSQHFDVPVPGGTWLYVPNSTTPYAMNTQIMAANQGPYSQSNLPGVYERSVPRPIPPPRSRMRDPQILPQSTQQPSFSHSTVVGPLPMSATTLPSPSLGKQTFPKAGEPPIARRSYHPDPPPNRSGWVMWIGNVPADASHNEIWEFIHKPDDAYLNAPTGVQSIYLLSRSCCAFVNFGSEAHLQTGIARFHGRPLRPDDPTCPVLVCRARRSDDDLKAGVGGQRGVGIHMRWIHDQLEERRTQRPTGPRVPNSADRAAAYSKSKKHLKNPSSISSIVDFHSDSPASTTSSLLEMFFPQRYFILKCRNEHGLDLSTQDNMWTTQKHNQGILGQAYRTSENVFLIFGANKTGEFYGYARMTGPIKRAKRQQSVAPDISPSSPPGSEPSPESSGRQPKRRTTLAGSLSPFELIEDPSPPTLTPSVTHGASVENPPARGMPSRHTPLVDARQDQLRNITPHIPESTPASPVPRSPPEAVNFDLNPAAAVVAMRSNRGSSVGSVSSRSIAAGGNEGESSYPPLQDETKGTPFKIEWICTEHLSFELTRHLRNPWNANREIKVSRDGTELEPTIGKLLLEAWGKAANVAGS